MDRTAGRNRNLRNYHKSSKGRGKRKKYPRIKPAADPKLKKAFSEIGIPEQKPFQPDSYQLEAIAAIEQADCLVTAPTGAGKTWIAEKAIAEIRKKGGKAWYASPLKALSNAIYAGFSARFGRENTGILTGDRKENPDAPVIVGTTEILRNHLYDAMEQANDLATDLVILDEAHFLGDEDRGVVWEEVMIYLPPRIPLLMLSATIGNAHQIADWLQSVRGRECRVVEEKNRPVPLYPLFFHPTGTLLPLVVQGGSKKKAIIYKKVVSYLQNKKKGFAAQAGQLSQMGDVIRVLRQFHLLPAIFFMKSRADCNNALSFCTSRSLSDDPDRKARLSRRITELTEWSPHLSRHKQNWHLANLAVGAHHSGQLPAWKIVIETLMTEGLLDAVFATSTVAAGVNFPARTVVLLNSDRFNGVAFQPLTPTEFHQMTGRAGRRGMDKIGFALALPGRFMDLRLMARLIHSFPSHVHSQIKINFSMVLNLLLSHTPGQIKLLLEKSFATYLIARHGTEKRLNRSDEGQTHLWQDFRQHLIFLKENGYVNENDELTEDGKWASRLRVDQPILLAEGFRIGIFPVSDPALLAGIVASFVEDRENVDENIGRIKIPKHLLTLGLRVKKELHPFIKRLTSRGFSARPIYLRPAAAIYAWANGESWDDVLRRFEMSDGDFAKLILRTADHLRHIDNLSEVFPELSETSRESIEFILKEPVISYMGG